MSPRRSLAAVTCLAAILIAGASPDPAHAEGADPRAEPGPVLELQAAWFEVVDPYRYVEARRFERGWNRGADVRTDGVVRAPVAGRVRFAGRVAGRVVVTLDAVVGSEAVVVTVTGLDDASVEAGERVAAGDRLGSGDAVQLGAYDPDRRSRYYPVRVSADHGGEAVERPAGVRHPIADGIAHRLHAAIRGEAEPGRSVGGAVAAAGHGPGGSPAGVRMRVLGAGAAPRSLAREAPGPAIRTGVAAVVALPRMPVAGPAMASDAELVRGDGVLQAPVGLAGRPPRQSHRSALATRLGTASVLALGRLLVPTTGRSSTAASMSGSVRTDERSARGTGVIASARALTTVPTASSGPRGLGAAGARRGAPAPRTGSSAAQAAGAGVGTPEMSAVDALEHHAGGDLEPRTVLAARGPERSSRLEHDRRDRATGVVGALVVVVAAAIGLAWRRRTRRRHRRAVAPATRMSAPLHPLIPSPRRELHGAVLTDGSSIIGRATSAWEGRDSGYGSQTDPPPSVRDSSRAPEHA